MNYHISRTVTLTFARAVERTMEELKKQGFGVLTEIDVRQTLQQKLGVDFRPYRILGACNPEFAHRAFQAEDKIGVMMPCNVVVQEKGGGAVEVSAVNPLVAMQAVGNPALLEVAREVTRRLERVIEGI